MQPIVKTFFNRHIDLDKLVSIGDVQLADQVTFNVAFALFFENSQPMVITVKGLENFTELVAATPDAQSAHRSIQAAVQLKVDELCERWMDWKQWKLDKGR